MEKRQRVFMSMFIVLAVFTSLRLVVCQTLPPRIAGRTIEYHLQLFLRTPLPTTTAEPTTTLVPPSSPTPPDSNVTSTVETTVATNDTLPPSPTTSANDSMTSSGGAETSGFSNTTTVLPTLNTTEENVATTTNGSTFFVRRRLLSYEPFSSEDIKENVTEQLKKAFEDVTGFKSVNTGDINTTSDANYQKYAVHYASSFDAQQVSNCLSNFSWCKSSVSFAREMGQALNRVENISLGGDTKVDMDSTKTFNDAFIQKEGGKNGSLVSQCTALLPCMEYGIKVTCRDKENQPVCVDVCTTEEQNGYCRGGTCQATNFALNGVKMCSCPFQTFHNNWECLSWWILLGPIIGAGALLILFLILMCVLCVRLRKRKEDEHLRKLYSGKDSLDRYHSEGNDNTGYMPEPVSLARYDNIELANGQANKEPQTFTAPANKPSENTRSSLRREEPPPVETKQEMRELRREPNQSEYRPLVEEKAPLAYHHQDDTPEPRRSMYDKNWEQELAKQYDSRDFNLQNVPQDKFQFNRPKVFRPGQASFGESAPVARF